MKKDIEKYEQKIRDCKYRSKKMIVGSPSFCTNVIKGKLYSKILKCLQELSDLDEIPTNDIE